MESLHQGVLGIVVPPKTTWWIMTPMGLLLIWIGWLLWREYSRLRYERREVVAAARRALQHSGGTISIVAQIQQWATSSELRETLTASAIRAVLALRETRNPDMNAVLTMMIELETPRLSIPRNAPNWFLLLGISGTIVGLVGSIGPLASQIQEAMQQLNPTTASEELGKALAQIREAFACSFWGVILAVVSSVSTRKVASDQQQTIAQIQQFILERVWKVVVEVSVQAKFHQR